jgi:hypothetical protein
MPRIRIGPALPDREALDAEIAQLRNLDAQRVRGRWHTVFGRPPPPHLSRKLMSQIRSKCGAVIILRDDVCVSRDVDTTQNRDSILAKARRRSLFTGIIGHTA